ncbi:MAG: 3'-5' exonuclease [Lachnospiraceae bacterium]|nr:3'-5' exonuclease [Lachnospiraceae bacterium]
MELESEYVVLDVETNGLSSSKDDLLSISIYKPDDGKIYDRFLPLELANKVLTTHINGIKKSDLNGAVPLNQKEVNDLIQTFELDKRVILTFSSFDEKFIKNYFKRKHLYGFEKMSFYNFKKDIISPRFSGGNVTKDNLCKLFEIKNVQDIHTGANDCILEWELFKKINEKKLFITNDKVFEMNRDYIVPVSYLNSHPNFKFYIGEVPNILFEQEIVKRFEIHSKKVKKMPTNFNGMIVEHLINTLLDVKKIDSVPFLYANKSKLKYIGVLPSAYDIVPMSFNKDGTVAAIRKQDKQMEKELNNFAQALKKEIQPMIQFIAKEIFHEQNIFSQELVVHPQNKILALCDLSTSDAVMEVKTNYTMNIYNFKEQLYYESNGRKCYLLQTDWSLMPDCLSFIISKVTFSIGKVPKSRSLEKRWEQFQRKIKNENITVLRYVNSNTKVKLRCELCGNEWETSCSTIVRNPACTFCSPIVKHIAKTADKVSEEEKKRLKEIKYYSKLIEVSDGTLKANNYTGCKDSVNVECVVCGHKWTTRADHLISRAYCPVCKKRKI